MVVNKEIKKEVITSLIDLEKSVTMPLKALYYKKTNSSYYGKRPKALTKHYLIVKIWTIWTISVNRLLKIKGYWQLCHVPEESQRRNYKQLQTGSIVFIELEAIKFFERTSKSCF